MTLPKWHHEARLEYVDALVLLETERLGYGAKFEAEVEAVLQRLDEFPRSSVQVHGLPRGVEVRAFPLNKFRYTLMLAFAADDPIVIAVADQRRKPGYWRGRLK